MSIDNLNQKLNGELPVTREELKELIKSWGEINDDYDQSVINVGMCYDLSRLDVSKITDMSYLFKNSPFDGDIGNWDVSNVTNMERMFWDAYKFNQPLNNWDTSNVTDMNHMFYHAKNFNQPLNFDTSKVTIMNYMFYGAEAFNQPVNFDTSKVNDMSYIFYDAEAFKDRYNNGEPLSYISNNIKEWLNNNREKMNIISIKDQHGEEIDNFFSKLQLLAINNKDR